MKKMNSIVRSEINAMVNNARRLAKHEKKPEIMRRFIEYDFAYASGVISSLLRADVISFSEWMYDLRVLKYHYCRLLSTYGNEPYMYKDGDRDFYISYVK